MKGLFILTLSIVLTSATCRKSAGIAAGTPRCIYDEIVNNRSNENWITGSVEEYQFQNKLVYAFQPDEKRIKDGATTIKDAECNVLCHVGGFGGPSINLCNGENFFKLSVLKRIVWKKNN